MLKKVIRLAKLASLLPKDPTSHKLPPLAESNIPVPKKASSLHAFEDAPEMKDTTPFTGGSERPRLATPKLTKRSSRIKPRKGSPGGYDTADEIDGSFYFLLCTLPFGLMSH